MKSPTLLVLASLLLALLALAPMAQAAGMSTHSTVGHRALYWFGNAEYKQLLESHRQWWQPGTFFPDWGYPCKYDTEAEASHWPRFLNYTANRIRDTYPRPWSQEAQNTIAFLFGMMAHSVADNSWHSLQMSEGLIEAMRFTEFHGSFGDAHSKADTGGEFILKYTTDLSGNAEPRWYIPSEFLFEAYQDYFPSTEVTIPVMEACLLIGFAGLWGNQIAGDLALPFIRNTPLLNEEYNTYFLGGLEDTSAWTSRCYEDLAQWLDVGGYIRPMCTLMDNQWDHDKLSEELDLELFDPNLTGQRALDFLHNRGYTVASQKEGKFLRLELQRLDGSDPLAHHSQEVEKITTQLIQEEQVDEGPAAAASCVKENHFRNSSTISYNIGTSYSSLGSVLATGDFNNDGIDDLVMGAPGVGSPGEPLVGAVYVVYGKRGMKPSVSLIQGIDQVASLILRGDNPYSRFGASLAVVDLNADGIDDLAIAAPAYNGLEMFYDGRVYVHFGSSAGLRTTASLTITTDQPYPERPPTGAHQFKFVLMGSSLSSGDADGDGFADLLIGSPYAAPHAQGHQVGMVSVIFSSSRHSGTEDLYDAADIELVGSQDYQRFGSQVGVAHLASGQTLIIVGSNFFATSELQTVGRLYGYDAKNPASPLFTITGNDEFQKFGSPFLIGSFYGDNRTVIAVSAISEQVGRQWQAGVLRVFDLEGLEGDLQFRNVDFETTIQGGERDGHFSWGLSASSNSLWVSEPYYGNFRADEKATTGRIYEYQFGNGFPTGVVRDRIADATSCVTGKDVRGQFGRSVLSLDLDSDGVEDLVVSSPHSYSGSPHSGMVSVFFG